MNRSRTKKLAASFVVIAALPGCKKMSGTTEPEPVQQRSASVFRADNGSCELMVPMSCPKGASCNPPPMDLIDCPPSQRDAGDPPAVTRRPKGKEDWVRLRTHLYVSTTGCSFTPERFCTITPKTFECTPTGETQTVPCTTIADDAGADATADASTATVTAPKKFHVEPFVYKDGVGTCRRSPALTCAIGDCTVPEGDPAPCP